MKRLMAMSTVAAVALVGAYARTISGPSDVPTRHSNAVTSSHDANHRRSTNIANLQVSTRSSATSSPTICFLPVNGLTDLAGRAVQHGFVELPQFKFVLDPEAGIPRTADDASYTGTGHWYPVPEEWIGPDTKEWASVTRSIRGAVVSIMTATSTGRVVWSGPVSAKLLGWTPMGLLIQATPRADAPIVVDPATGQIRARVFPDAMATLGLMRSRDALWRIGSKAGQTRLVLERLGDDHAIAVWQLPPTARGHGFMLLGAGKDGRSAIIGEVDAAGNLVGLLKTRTHGSVALLLRNAHLPAVAFASESAMSALVLVAKGMPEVITVADGVIQSVGQLTGFKFLIPAGRCVG